MIEFLTLRKLLVNNFLTEKCNLTSNYYTKINRLEKKKHAIIQIYTDLSSYTIIVLD